MSRNPVKIFISYAHKDEEYFKLLKEGIASHSKHSRGIQFIPWSDQDILPGQKWHEAIQDKVQSCDCALLLVSANFLASDYIEKHEFNTFIERQEQGEFRFFPILVSPCAIEHWEELYSRQFFRARGKEYGRPDTQGLLSYSELIAFDTKGSLIPNAERERYHRDLVKALEKAIAPFLAEAEQTAATTSLKSVKTGRKDTATSLEIGNYSFKPANTTNLFEKPEDNILPLAMQDFRFKRSELDKRSGQEDLAEASNLGNQMARLVLEEQNRLREKVFDSEHLKQLYVHVHFDEIAYGEELEYNTEKTITEKRQQRSRFPWYERSLIVSALSISLLQQLNADKMYHLMDFVRDKEDFVWKRALTGLILALILHEDELPAGLINDLLILKKDEEVQEGIIKIEEELASKLEAETIEKYKTETGFDESYEFFEKPQHWFLPFYPENPVVLEKIWDQKLRDALPGSTAWPIDAFKYAFCFNFSNLDASTKKRVQEKIGRAERQAVIWHNWNRNKYPEEDSEAAYRKDIEYRTYMQEILFFLSNYPKETFRGIQLEKISLYKSSLSEILLEDIYLLQIEAIHYYFFAEDYTQALSLLKKLHEHFPSDSALIRRIAYCYSELKEYNQAITWQQQAAESEPENANVWGMLGYYSEQTKEYQKGLEYRLKAEKLNPDMAWNLAGIVNCFITLEDLEKAIEYQKRAAQSESDDAVKLGRWGYYYELKKEYQPALENRLKAEKLKPDMAWNLAGIAECYDELEDYEKAIDYQRRATELEPKNASRWGMLGHFYKQNKDYQTALEYRLKAEKIKPNMAWNLAGIADCYDELEDYEKAIEYQRRAAELEPDNASGWGILGYYYEQNKDYHSALEYYLKAEKLKPDMAWNLAEIARCYDALEDYEKAIEYQRRAAELEPDNANQWGILGYYYKQSKNYQTALEYRLKGEKLNPDLAWNLVGIASCYEELKNFEQAITYQKRAVELEPENDGSWEKLGQLYLHTDQKTEANQCFEKALELDFARKDKEPQNHDVYGSIGWTYFLKENFALAKEHFVKEIQLAPEDKLTYHPFMNLGHIAFLQNNTDEAIKLYRQAYAVSRRNSSTAHLQNGFEEDWPLLERQGVSKETYWELIEKANAGVEKA